MSFSSLKLVTFYYSKIELYFVRKRANIKKRSFQKAALTIKAALTWNQKGHCSRYSLVGLQQYLSNAVIQVGGSKHGREEVGEKGESEE